MSSVIQHQETSPSRLEDNEKPEEKPISSNDDDNILGDVASSPRSSPRSSPSASPLADTVIRKIRIPLNCDMRSGSNTNDKVTQSSGESSPVIGGQNCDTYNNVDSDLFADKYTVYEQILGSSLYRCMDVKSKEEFVCKKVSRGNHSLISAHYRLDSHPQVQSLQEVFVGQRYLYLVFPQPHGDLHSYVRERKRLRETEARRLFRQIAETVQLCHQNGIVLRDLKLRKFVFTDPEQTQLKLESFEDAVVLDESESDWLHDKRGCPAYVSPEILKHGHYSGKMADMWSMGVILFTMLAGRYPFNDAGQANLFARILSGSFALPDCVSPRARCLIKSLLRMEPSERILSEDILYHPWLARQERRGSSSDCDQTVPKCSLYDDWKFYIALICNLTF